MPVRAVAIIQARMGSSRLPGKVLLDIAGQPMLKRVVARTNRAASVGQVVVATTTEPADDPVAQLCQAQGFACTRGSQFDVLDRYYQAARQFQAGIVVRVTADCPVIDPKLVDQAVDALVGTGKPEFDFVANRLPPPYHRTYPIGLDVEVCRFEGLEQAWKESTEPVQREHVMPYLYEGVQLSPVSPQLATGTSQRGFRIALINHDPDYGDYRWTVDTPEDLEFMRQLYRRFDRRDDFSWLDVLDVIHAEPGLSEINAGVQHKTLSDFDDRALKR